MSLQPIRMNPELPLYHRTGLLSDDDEFMVAIKEYPFTEQLRIMESYHRTCQAMSRMDDRHNGDPAFQHPRDTALLVAKIFNAPGYRQAEPVIGALEHDNPEDVLDIIAPYTDRRHLRYRMIESFGEDVTAILLLVSKGKLLVQQEEEDHLEQMVQGRHIFFNELRRQQPLESRLSIAATEAIWNIGRVVRFLRGQEVQWRYPLGKDAWRVFVARIIKCSDRVTNMQSYTHPDVYGKRLDRLAGKTGISKKYYQVMAAQVMAVAPQALQASLLEYMVEPLSKCIRECDVYLTEHGCDPSPEPDETFLQLYMPKRKRGMKKK